MKRLIYTLLLTFISLCTVAQNTGTLPDGTNQNSATFRTIGTLTDSLAKRYFIQFQGGSFNEFYTATFLNKYFVRNLDTAALFAPYIKISDTTSMLAPYAKLVGDNTFDGNQVFNDITALGSIVTNAISSIDGTTWYVHGDGSGYFDATVVFNGNHISANNIYDVTDIQTGSLEVTGTITAGGLALTDSFSTPGNISLTGGSSTQIQFQSNAYASFGGASGYYDLGSDDASGTLLISKSGSNAIGFQEGSSFARIYEVVGGTKVDSVLWATEVLTPNTGIQNRNTNGFVLQHNSGFSIDGEAQFTADYSGFHSFSQIDGDTWQTSIVDTVGVHTYVSTYSSGSFGLNGTDDITGSDIVGTFQVNVNNVAGGNNTISGTPTDVNMDMNFNNPVTFTSPITFISATSPILFDSSTGAISAQYASASQDGVLSAADWTNFNTSAGAGAHAAVTVYSSALNNYLTSSGSVVAGTFVNTTSTVNTYQISLYTNCTSWTTNSALSCTVDFSDELNEARSGYLNTTNVTSVGFFPSACYVIRSYPGTGITIYMNAATGGDTLNCYATIQQIPDF